MYVSWFLCFCHCRNVVIDLLRKSGPSAKLKKADVMDAAKTALKRGINDKEYNKVSFYNCSHDPCLVSFIIFSNPNYTKCSLWYSCNWFFAECQTF